MALRREPCPSKEEAVANKGRVCLTVTGWPPVTFVIHVWRMMGTMEAGCSRRRGWEAEQSGWCSPLWRSFCEL